MNELSIINDIEGKFEDLSIYIHHLMINPVFDLSPKQERVIAFTQVGENIVVHHSHPDKISMIGGIMINLRNQGEDDNLLLIVSGDISVNAEYDSNPASILCKTIQYFYNFLKDYVKENEIKDSNDELFLIPPFQYSKYHFEESFQRR